MTKTTHLHPMLPLSPPLLRFLLLFLSSSFLLHLVAVEGGNSSNSTGFSMKLIHRDSIFSPLHPGNLTASQWFRRQVEYSKSYIQRLESSIMTTPNDDVTPRPPVYYHNLLYMVFFGIGSPPVSYFLILDSGSDLTWTQCVACDPCHNQVGPIFNPEHSLTYSSMQCRDPLCMPPYYDCVDGHCTFNIRYGGGYAYSKGLFARETFTFPSNTNQWLSIPNIAFGCSVKASEQIFNGYTAGILGLGGGSQSIMSQLEEITHGSFSYCLVGGEQAAQDKYSYLRFGFDLTIMNEPVQVTPFVQTNFPTIYYLNLLDISVNGIHLHIPAGTFERKPDNTGGFFIDTGAALSVLQADAYKIFRDSLILYFFTDEFEQVHPHDDVYPTDLCYKIPVESTEYPYITFHFQNADMKVGHREVFHINEEAGYFCLAIYSNPSYNILGAMQQANYRFLYDVRTQWLVFSPENCAAESG